MPRPPVRGQTCRKLNIALSLLAIRDCRASSAPPPMAPNDGCPADSTLPMEGPGKKGGAFVLRYSCFVLYQLLVVFVIALPHGSR